MYIHSTYQRPLPSLLDLGRIFLPTVSGPEISINNENEMTEWDRAGNMNRFKLEMWDSLQIPGIVLDITYQVYGIL